MGNEPNLASFLQARVNRRRMLGIAAGGAAAGILAACGWSSATATPKAARGDEQRRRVPDGPGRRDDPHADPGGSGSGGIDRLRPDRPSRPGQRPPPVARSP